MNQAPPSSAIVRRKKLLIQVLAFLALVALILLKPRIEEWVDAQNQKSDASVAGKTAEKSKNQDDTEWVSPFSPPTGPEKSNSPKKKEATTGSAELGRLKEVRNNIFQSSAGLIYRSGSEDGHRLKHVMQHAKDNPQKKIHGVFDGDGDRNIVLAVIDEAYLKASQGGSDVRSQRQNDRQVYTVNLHRRIGKVGGEEGERKGHPECRYVRIVLENGNEVISAYPTSSF